VGKAQAPRPPRRPTSPDGLIVVDKPQGMTSHDVVARLRRLCGTRAVGHGGTLDPMATGVLICGIGKGTKLLTFILGADKAYSATIRLGISTSTDDAEGETIATNGACLTEPDGRGVTVTAEQFEQAIAKLTGEIQQVPSAVSAIKIDGQRAYALAREGKQVELAARPVTVSEFEVESITATNVAGIPVIDLDVKVTVSSGTYVRALARDLGAALRTDAHLTRLRRTRIGKVTLDGCDGQTALLAWGADRVGESGQLADQASKSNEPVDQVGESEEPADQASKPGEPTSQSGAMSQPWRAYILEELEQLGDAANARGEALATMPLGQAARMFLPVRVVSDQEAQALSQGKFISLGNIGAVTAAIDASGKLVAIIEPANQTKAKPKVVFPWGQLSP